MKVWIPAVFFLSVSLAFAQDAQWSRIEIKEGACSIEFPGKPTDPGKLDQNQSKGQQLILEVRDGKAVYMLQYNQFANTIPIDQADVVKRIFGGGQSGLVNALKGKISRSDDGKFGEFPIRDIEMEVASLGVYKVRFVLTGDRFYQVTAVGPKDFTEGKDVQRFMKSFQINK